MTNLTWEAFRLTSKSPAEVLHVLGPHGVDDLIRKAMDAVWREYPEQDRTYDLVKKRILETYDRNMRHWTSIKKPSPQAFFENLLPYTADGHIRQALVLTWMMLPRAGGRDFKQVRSIVEQIFQRNLAAWDEDRRTFTHQTAKKRAAPSSKKASSTKPRPAASKPAKSKPKKPTRKNAARKSRK
jgi:hypothetical protein